MKEPLPLLQLKQQVTRARRNVDVAAVATQLGILPDLRFLVGGLRRSRRCINLFQGELAECLRGVPGRRLEPDALIEAIDELLAWCSEQHWQSDDPRVQPLARAGAEDRHPLAGYCLSVSFHWPNLFYSLEPGETSADLPGTPEHGFEIFMAEFSMYVLAAQATIDPNEYMDFCRRWWRSKPLPERMPFPERTLAGRVAAASRAARRLGLQQHAALFHCLRGRTGGAPLYTRISHALEKTWSEADEKLLLPIARLLEDVRLGWSRQTKPRPRRRGKQLHRRIVRHAYRDGYVRILGGGGMRRDSQTEDGVAVEHFRPIPPRVDDLTKEIKLQLEETLNRELEEEEADAGAGRRKRPASAELRKQAELEAKILLDGAEWFPAEEDSGPGLDCIEIGQETPSGEVGEPGRATSKWVAEHVRRFQYAHGVGPSRLIFDDAIQLLTSMRAKPPDCSDKAALIALHACLALGRRIGEVTALEIHDGSVYPKRDSTGVHYSLEKKQWVVPCPVPAWAERELDPDERPQWSWLWLKDQTGFFDLLHHFGMARAGQPFQKLTGKRERAITSFIKRSIPYADATLTHCSDFLFYQLLACNHGDLGIASLITGHEHSHGASVRHYSNFPASQIWQAYQVVWDVSRNGSRAPVNSNGKRENPRDTGGYGAKRVPTADAVTRRITRLAEVSMRDACAVHRHNAYTAYTLAGLVLGLGMRPVVEPRFTHPIEVAREGLLLTYLDKARSDYDRRINAVPERLADHLQRYFTYRKCLRANLSKSAIHARFIYIDPVSGRAMRFRPSHFLIIDPGTFDLELYAFRRFMRSELRCRFGVHAEDVDAYMGHWLYRVGPHDKHSTYPMQRLRWLAEGEVSDVLASVGFLPLAPPP